MLERDHLVTSVSWEGSRQRRRERKKRKVEWKRDEHSVRRVSEYDIKIRLTGVTGCGAVGVSDIYIAKPSW